MAKSLLYFSLFIFFACNSKADKGKRQPNAPVQWQFLTLEFDDTTIRMARSIDTLEVATSTGVQKYPISNSNKDNLFLWSNELLNFQGQPNKFCTDYVGRLRVRIRYNSQLLKEVHFSSLCDWRELGSNTNRIDQLLKQVVRAE